MGKYTKRRKIAEKKGEKPHTEQDRMNLLKEKHIEDLCDLESQLRSKHKSEMGSGKVSKASYDKLIKELTEKDELIKNLRDEKQNSEQDEKDKIIEKLTVEKTKMFEEKEEILDKYRDLQVVFIDIVKHETYKVNRFYVLSEIAKLHCEDDTLEVLTDHLNTDKDQLHELNEKQPVLTQTTIDGFKERFAVQKHFKTSNKDD